MGDQALVMCGGRGTRFRPITFYFNKVMVPIGSRERPLLELVVRELAENGFDDLIMLVGYKGHQIVNYFGDGSRFGVRMRYSWDPEWGSGSGAALLNAREMVSAEDFVVYYGDILTRADLRSPFGAHSSSGAAVTVMLSSNYPVPVGVAEVEGSGRMVRVRGFVEKPPLGKPAAMAIYFMNRRVFDVLEDLRRSGRISLDISGDLIPELLRRGEEVAGWLTEEDWVDVGSLATYEKLNGLITPGLREFVEG